MVINTPVRLSVIDTLFSDASLPKISITLFNCVCAFDTYNVRHNLKKIASKKRMAKGVCFIFRNLYEHFKYVIIALWPDVLRTYILYSVQHLRITSPDWDGYFDNCLTPVGVYYMQFRRLGPFKLLRGHYLWSLYHKIVFSRDSISFKISSCSLLFIILFILSHELNSYINSFLQRIFTYSQQCTGRDPSEHQLPGWGTSCQTT